MHTKRDDLNKPRSPDEYDFSALCLDSYQDAPGILPNGWIRYTDSRTIKNTRGYFGAVYIRPKDNLSNTYIAYVHRGTEFTINDIISDIMIFFNGPIIQFYAAYDFMSQAKNMLCKEYGQKEVEGFDVINTGHSLGGVIASFFSSYEIFGFTRNTITFENPGSLITAEQTWRLFLNNKNPKPEPKEIETTINRLLQDGLYYITNHQTHYNIIDTCNKQMGMNYYLYRMLYDYNVTPAPIWPFDIPKEFYLNRHYCFGYSLSVHRISAICDYFKNYAGEGNLNYNEGGLQNGYDQYLNYEDGKPYWDGYFTFTWGMATPQQRKNFNDDLILFRSACIEQLNKLCHTSIESHEIIPTGLVQHGLFSRRSVRIENSYVMIEKDEAPKDFDKKRGCSIF